MLLSSRRFSAFLYTQQHGKALYLLLPVHKASLRFYPTLWLSSCAAQVPNRSCLFRHQLWSPAQDFVGQLRRCLHHAPCARIAFCRCARCHRFCGRGASDAGCLPRRFEQKGEKGRRAEVLEAWESMPAFRAALEAKVILYDFLMTEVLLTTA